MSIILFSRPSHDDITSYLYLYSRSLVNLAKEKGYIVSNQEKGDANKKNISSVLTKKNPKFIMFNGHGDETKICGHHDETLIEANINHKLLNGSIVYCLSCSSACTLGPISVKDGTIAFIGYEDDFALVTDVRYEATPLKDKTAKLFLEPSNLLVQSILKGNNILDSLKKCRDKMEDNISKLKTSSDPEAVDILPWLHYNYIGLVIHGDEQARVE